MSTPSLHDRTAVADRRALVLLHAGFLLAGMATTLLGPMMPLLMTRWALSDASAGALFTAQFMGQTMSTVGSSWLTGRFGSRSTLALGAWVIAAGIAAMALAPWPLGAVAACVYGMGLGLVLPTTNFAIAALRPAGAASALSLLNVSWGIGAVLWPLVVRLSMAAVSHPAAPLLLLGTAMAILGGVFASRPATWPGAGPATAPATTTGAGEDAPARPVRASLVAMFAALCYLYVGTEAAIGGWIAEFTRRAGSGPGVAWTLAPTAFWGAETLGRLTSPLLLRRVSETRLLTGGLLVAGTAVVLLIGASGSVGLALGGAIVAGLGLAPIFPLLLADMSRRIAPAGPRWMGPLFAMGGLGGASVPWLVGMTSTRSGALRAGLFVPLAALAVMLGVHLLARRSRR